MSEPQYDYSDMPDPIEQRDAEIRKLKGKIKSLREALERVNAVRQQWKKLDQVPAVALLLHDLDVCGLDKAKGEP